MIKYYEGTVFNSGCEWIVNTVNCEGVMGAGIALEFRLRYPEMFERYKKDCKAGNVRLGEMSYYISTDGKDKILNFPTKHFFKYGSKISWIEEGLKNFVETYKEYGIKSIAFTKLGCGKGGLDWNAVKALMEKYLSPLEDINIVICLDVNKVAEGKEKEMVDAFNNTPVSVLSDYVKLTSKQKEALQMARPIDRFFKLEKLDGIGKTTYENIFNHFYRGKIVKTEYVETIEMKF